MIPAIPGIVSVKLFENGKKPVIAQNVPATCPIRPITATTPGSLYSDIMNIIISANAITPAIAIASRAPVPSVGEIVLKLDVSSLNGNAPPFIWSASALASSAVKLPLIVASPPLISSFTVAVEMHLSSIYVEMYPFDEASFFVASANFSLPLSFSFKDTIYSYSLLFPLLS